MKRRTADSKQHRKQFHFRKCKLTEGICGSGAFVYLKFLLIWALIMIADFLIEFRFEFLWPFWLLLRSINDSFKYQGLLFSIFFALTAFLCDLFCYIFIPVQWLFFASSTYVWVQFVWHTGSSHIHLFCLSFKKKQREVRKVNNHYQQLLIPSLPLEMQQQLNAIDAQQEAKQIKQQSHEDEISSATTTATATTAPPPPPSLPPQTTPVLDTQPVIAHSLIQNIKDKFLNTKTSHTHPSHSQLNIYDDDLPYIQQKDHTSSSSSSSTKYQNNTKLNGLYQNSTDSYHNLNGDTTATQSQPQAPLATTVSSKMFKNKNNVHSSSGSGGGGSTASQSNAVATVQTYDTSSTNGSGGGGAATSKAAICTAQPSINANHTNININMTINATAIAAAAAQNTTINTNATQGSQTGTNVGQKSKNKNNSHKDLQSQQQQQQPTTTIQLTKDDFLQRIGDDLKKSQQELQSQKSIESYLRSQIDYFSKCDRTDKIKLEKLQQENEQLQARLQKMQTTKQKDKDDLIQLYEKKLLDEKRARAGVEQQLQQERKCRENSNEKFIMNGSGNGTAATTTTTIKLLKKTDCNEYCQQKLKDYEKENKSLAEQMNEKQDRIRNLENEVKALLKYRDSQNRMDSLMSALNVMEEKNLNLQDSLSAETRFKLDLFSALGETRRQLDAAIIQLEAKEKELNTYKCIFKTAFTPQPSVTASQQHQQQNSLSSNLMSMSGILSSTDTSTCSTPSLPTQINSNTDQLLSQLFSQQATHFQSPFSAQLDPNASIYTPKI